MGDNRIGMKCLKKGRLEDIELLEAAVKDDLEIR